MSISSGSQTVGPFFRIGLDYLQGQSPIPESGTPGRIEMRGRVLDGDGAPVPDALLEFWGADPSGAYLGESQNTSEYPSGFHRVATDQDGGFSLVTMRPGIVGFGHGRMQAPHMLVLVFARGLLRHLITRVYLEGEPSNATDPVLLEVPVERRGTLVARPAANDSAIFHWNVVLQGEEETVFFAW